MTKVLALSWLGNTQKSSLIHWYEHNIWIADALMSEWLSVKVMDEVARDCYNLLEDKSISTKHRMYEFQKQIHLQETARILEAIEEKKQWIYDAMVVDRTWLDNILYANQNHIWNQIKKPDFFQEDPGEDFYDHIVLLTHPTKNSMKEEFDIYWEERFRRRFDKVIRWYYGDKVKTFRNWKEDWDAIIEYILDTITK